MAVASLLPPLPDLSGLVSQPLDSLGYVPVQVAADTCEGIARWKVEETLARIQRSGELEAAALDIGADLEARCRGYVEYTGVSRTRC